MPFKFRVSAAAVASRNLEGREQERQPSAPIAEENEHPQIDGTFLDNKSVEYVEPGFASNKAAQSLSHIELCWAASPGLLSVPRHARAGQRKQMVWWAAAVGKSCLPGTAPSQLLDEARQLYRKPAEARF